MDLQKTKNQIEQVKSKKSFLEGQKESLEKQRDKLAGDIKELNTTPEQLPHKMKALEDEVTSESSKLNQLLGDIDGTVRAL